MVLTRHAHRLGPLTDPYALDHGALMPFATHLRITALGTLGASDERFSYGINTTLDPGQAAGLGGDGSTVPAPLAAAADVVKQFHTRVSTRIASVAVLRSVKFAVIGPDGKYVGDAVEAPVTAGEGGVNDGSGLVLPQNALAVSLLTDDRGPRKRGRFYIPMPVIDVQPSNGFTMAVAWSNGVADSAAQLLTDLQAVPDLSIQPVIASTYGYNTPVTGVRVGRVVDTIRSRRNRLVELYSTVRPV